MNGYDMAYIQERTGITLSKLKMIVLRNPELRDMPYSVKAGGRRVFFDAFIEWLKQYEGVTKVTASVTSETPAATRHERLPNGAQLDGMLRIYGREAAARRLDFILGYATRYEVASPKEAILQLELIKDQYPSEAKS